MSGLQSFHTVSFHYSMISMMDPPRPVQMMWVAGPGGGAGGQLYHKITQLARVAFLGQWMSASGRARMISSWPLLVMLRSSLP